MSYRDNGTHYADCDLCDWTAEADDRRDAHNASAAHADTHDDPSPTYADRMDAWWEAVCAGDPTA